LSFARSRLVCSRSWRGPAWRTGRFTGRSPLWDWPYFSCGPTRRIGRWDRGAFGTASRWRKCYDTIFSCCFRRV
jgi:hypothetical protein